MGVTGIGAPLRRIEDPPLLRGRGRYVADIDADGALHCVLVRSPHAHAHITAIDTAAALGSPSVVAVLTGADMAAENVGPMRPLWAIRSADGSPMAEPPRFALARDAVRHVGEPVCAVIAESNALALDAADRVRVDYAPLPAVIDPHAAMAADAPQLHETAPGNICFRWARGDEGAVQRAFATAAHVVGVDLINNRLIGAAIEPRAALALPATGSAKLTLFSSTQTPHHIRRMVAEQLGMPESAMRLIAPDVGGGFGYKGKLYPEESIVAFAARRLARPVRWVASRAESFISDNQGRDHITKAELALDADGALPLAGLEEAFDQKQEEQDARDADDEAEARQDDGRQHGDCQRAEGQPHVEAEGEDEAQQDEKDARLVLTRRFGQVFGDVPGTGRVIGVDLRHVGHPPEAASPERGKHPRCEPESRRILSISPRPAPPQAQFEGGRPRLTVVGSAKPAKRQGVGWFS